ncbi:NAD(P)-dependent oxidoreductase [Mesorhizobium sp. Cs1321R2N1]|uniref:NAD(P)-dependent oxidoreductase n=1 Tax=Mesorhizobium sp. Cs1321R2N1 TaxID=3015174 RepID=UPI003FA54936
MAIYFHRDEATSDLWLRGKIEAAALDVFREEPLPVDDPFWSHRKVSVTPMRRHRRTSGRRPSSSPPKFAV